MPSNIMYKTPQSTDGRFTRIVREPDGSYLADIEFDLPDFFVERIRGQTEHVVFVARSRLARLGINVVPVNTPPVFEKDKAFVQARVRTFVPSYKVDRHLDQLIVPGLQAGRLVFCDPARRLTAKQVYEAYERNEFQLPSRFSIDNLGRVVLVPHRCVYDLPASVTLRDLISVVARQDGASVYNRLRVRRPVQHIIVEPGEGVITSCTVYLHRHFIVLDSEATCHGMHLQATVLDPVTTRGPNVYLEFANVSDTTIVNPVVAGAIYLADEVQPRQRTWYGTLPEPAEAATRESTRAYEEIVGLYRGFGEFDQNVYVNRPVGVATNVKKTLSTGKLDQLWCGPKQATESGIAPLAARQFTFEHFVEEDHCGTHLLKELPDDVGATVFLQYFPSLVEHVHLCSAAMRKAVRRIVFRRASFEHGPFLSAHDHGRLADYEALGLDVLWCNDLCGHIARHVYRGLRGYFCPIELSRQLKQSLVIAFYGSTIPLPPREAERLEKLIGNLQTFFGGNLGLLTGGGPGAMQQTMEIGLSRGLSVGSSFLELVDARIDSRVHFYQTFQENARHNRQRWFEVSSFQIFCIGGLGTLEEIGLTLTDLKLGVSELRPVVFFGEAAERSYWADMVAQLKVIAREGRGPQWLNTHILLTCDPDEVISFYERLLEVA